MIVAAHATSSPEVVPSVMATEPWPPPKVPLSAPPSAASVTVAGRSPIGVFMVML